jgi:hypothetical protein
MMLPQRRQVDEYMWLDTSVKDATPVNINKSSHARSKIAQSLGKND